ncbi:hypothetical protein [Runella zeae]|uniref:hypothetical protein n=1 Tax=Runella zeae TaxID=94255 RepID=UPI0012F7941D|nr:hypothetical protein [Runella zeae]
MNPKEPTQNEDFKTEQMKFADDIEFTLLPDMEAVEDPEFTLSELYTWPDENEPG